MTRGGELAAHIAAFVPRDAEAVARSPNDLADIDRDLCLADIGERVLLAGIIVEDRGALLGREIIGGGKVLAQHDRIGRA